MAWTFYDNQGRIKTSGNTGVSGVSGVSGSLGGTGGTGGTGGSGVSGVVGSTSTMAYIWSSRRDLITGAISPFIHCIAAGTISKVYMDMPGVAAPLGTITIDVKKNGTSIFVVATKPTMSSANTDGSGGYKSALFTPDATTVIAGSQLQVVVDNAGVDLEVGRLKVYIVMS